MTTFQLLLAIYGCATLGAFPYTWERWEELTWQSPWRHLGLSVASALCWPIAMVFVLASITGVQDWAEDRVQRYVAYRQQGDGMFLSTLFAFWPWPLVGIVVICLSFFGWVFWQAVWR